MASLLRKMNKLANDQDYVVIPEQRWLDGISTEPGTVRQFVAAETAPPRHTNDSQATSHRGETPEPPSHEKAGGNVSEHREPILAGASIEWQVTGSDSVGGIQLQIIPQFDVGSMSAASMEDTCIRAEGSGELQSYDTARQTQARAYDVLKTPKELGLSDGEIIHLKDLKSRQPSRPKAVADIIQESSESSGEGRLRGLGLEICFLNLTPMMEIVVATPKGENTTIQVPQSGTVSDIKWEMSDKKGIPVDWQRLTYRKIRLEDNLALSVYNIRTIGVPTTPGSNE